METPLQATQLQGMFHVRVRRLIPARPFSKTVRWNCALIRPFQRLQTSECAHSTRPALLHGDSCIHIQHNALSL